MHKQSNVPWASCPKSCGYTLLELMAVVAMLTITAAIAVPYSSSNNHQGVLDAATTELLNTFRLAQARSESNGVFTAVRIQENTTIEVLEVDGTASPPEPTTTHIIHPLTKRPYIINLSERPSTASVSFDLNDGPFVSRDSSTTEFLFFDPRGRPYVVDSSGISFLAATNFRVLAGTFQRQIQVDQLSGRARLVEP